MIGVVDPMFPVISRLFPRGKNPGDGPVYLEILLVLTDTSTDGYNKMVSLQYIIWILIY